jgi:hypothetical protein
MNDDIRPEFSDQPIHQSRVGNRSFHEGVVGTLCHVDEAPGCKIVDPEHSVTAR